LGKQIGSGIYGNRELFGELFFYSGKEIMVVLKGRY
jgi:hypothetical protein